MCYEVITSVYGSVQFVLLTVTESLSVTVGREMVETTMRVAGLTVCCLCVALPPRVLAKSNDFIALPSSLLALPSTFLALPPCVLAPGILALAPGFLAFLLYVNTLGAHFVYDDQYAVLSLSLSVNLWKHKYLKLSYKCKVLEMLYNN